MHHATNPYLYNPAFAGNEKYPVLFTTYRQQWLGVEGAPVSSNLSFHMPAGHANPISLGADISNDKVGILTTTAGKGTFAYLIPLGVKKEHFFRFGLSAGLGLRQFDLTDTDIGDDLVLQNALNKGTFWDGRFGIHYHLENLNLGFALPHLFDNPLVSPDGISSLGIDPLSRFLVSANYRINFNATGSFAFEPTVLYNVSQELGNQLDAFGLLYVGEALWVGGGYQQQSGIAGILGFKIKNIKIGYAYGTGGNGIAEISSGTHEAQIGIILGKKREVMKRKPRLSTTSNGEKVPEAAIIKSNKKKKGSPVPDRKKAPARKTASESEMDISSPEDKENVPSPPREITKEQPVEAGKDTLAPAQKTIEYSQLQFESLDKDDDVILLKKESQGGTNNNNTAAQTKNPENPVTPEATVHPQALQGGKYIIAGSFSKEDNAQALISKLIAEGYQAALGYHTEKSFYYVYVRRSDNLETLKQELEQLKQLPVFKHAWILSVDP